MRRSKVHTQTDAEACGTHIPALRLCTFAPCKGNWFVTDAVPTCWCKVKFDYRLIITVIDFLFLPDVMPSALDSESK